MMMPPIRPSSPIRQRRTWSRHVRLSRSAAPKFDVQNIPVDDILVVGARRPLVEERVPDFVESIKRGDLINPITVRIQENVRHPETGEVLTSAHVLVTGLHRLEAYRRLGLRHIPARVRDYSQLEAEIAEIDENL